MVQGGLLLGIIFLYFACIFSSSGKEFLLGVFVGQSVHFCVCGRKLKKKKVLKLKAYART